MDIKAKRPPITGSHKGTVDGKFKARISPVTTADRSLMVIVFFIKRSYKYSAKTHVVIVVTIINKAFILN